VLNSGYWTAELARFSRRREDRWLGGVTGGLAVATDIPVWAWRILFVLLALLNGVGVVLYLLMWIFVPLAPLMLTAPTEPPATS
jgi:phage shock protein C